MAYTFLWIDGFDEISSIDQKYSRNAEVSPDINPPVTSNTPFNYGRAHQLSRSGAELILQKAITSGPYTVFFLGFHVFSSFTDTAERNFIQFLDAQNNVVQIELRRSWNNVRRDYPEWLDLAQREVRLQPDQRGGGGQA